MWYSGHDGTDHGIGYATSTDGITWDKYDINPVLEKGLEDSWECGKVIRPKVARYKNDYIMLYGGNNESAQIDMGCARSLDGITWEKDRHNPVMTQNYSWESCQVSVGAILILEDAFQFQESSRHRTSQTTVHCRTNRINRIRYHGWGIRWERRSWMRRS